MKRGALLVGVILVMASGCANKTEVQGEGGKKLALTAPLPTTIKQGETAKITVKASRTGFDSPVELDFSHLPDGVTIEEGSKRIEKGSNEATFTLKATDKAPPETGSVAKVSGSSEGMKAGPLEFKVDVKEKK
jgi:hypothetical protein